jgi:hypothetical protein
MTIAEPKANAIADRFTVRAVEKPRDFGRTLDLLAELLVTLAIKDIEGERRQPSPLTLCV